jgi:hypothetical protein
MAPRRPVAPAKGPTRLPVGDPHARVHVAAVGFEVERVTDPVLAERADRVYLLTKAEEDAARPFVDEVVRRLRAADPSLDVRVTPTAIWDVFGSLEQLRRIFAAERRTERRAPGVVPIRVNVSTGTKISAIAGTLACMLWRGEPYYVQVSRSWYSSRTPTVRPINDVVRSVEPVGVYELRAPSRELVEVLEALARAGGTMRKRELIGSLGLKAARPGEGNGRAPSPQAQHGRLRRRLEPLEGKWGFVESDAGVRGRVRITEQGRLALALFGRGGDPAPPIPDSPH